jgi:hypothetical protein
MRLSEIAKLINREDERPELKLVLKEIFYSPTFLQAVNTFNDTKLGSYQYNVLDHLDWALSPLGFIILKSTKVQGLYIKGEMYNGIVAYFNLYGVFRRTANENLVQIAKKLNFDEVDTHIFFKNFHSKYWDKKSGNDWSQYEDPYGQYAYMEM